MTTANTASECPMDYLGGLTFPAQEFDLTTIPDNKQAARTAEAIMPLVRMCALFLHESDEQLETKVRATGSGDALDEWVGLLEEVGAALDEVRQQSAILEAGFTRLLIVTERIIGKPDLDRAYCNPTQPDPQHFAKIRARLYGGRTGRKPRLLTEVRS